MTTRELYKMKALYALWVAIWAVLILIAASQGRSSEFPSEFHDPALDTINNNMAILDADLNGNFAVVNSNLAAMTVFGQERSKTNAMDLNKAGLPAQYSPGGSYNFTSGGQTNAMGLSNAMAGIFTNYGRFLGPVRTNLSEIINTNPVANTSAVSITLALPKLFRGSPGLSYSYSNMNLGTLGEWEHPEIANGCRYFILGFAVIIYFFRLLDDLKKNIGETFSQRQTVGTPQGVFGWNASLPTSLFYAFVITAAVVTVCVAVAAFGVSNIMSQIGTVGGWQESAFGWLNSVPFFSLISSFVPIWNLVLLHIFYLLGRTLLIAPAFMCVRCIILWLPS